MKTFEVFVEISYEASFICEAQTEEEAREIALAKIDRPDDTYAMRVSNWLMLDETE